MCRKLRKITHLQRIARYDWLLILFLFALLPQPVFPSPDIAPLFATFSFADQQTTRIFVTAPEACRVIREIASGKRKDMIPNGIIIDDRPAKSPYDSRWSWHFQPDSVEMAEFTIEVCDATPTYVEEHMDEWFQGEKTARWCPWSAHLVKIEDLLYRDVNHNGRVTLEDARLALRILTGQISPTESQRVASDVHPSQGANSLPGDGRITLSDVMIILRQALGLERES